MFSRLGSCLLLLVLLGVACKETDPDPLAVAGPVRPVGSSVVSSNSQTTDDSYIVVAVDSVTINRSGESPPNEVTEFRMVLVGSDGEWSNGVYCPGTEAYRLRAGQTFEQSCLFAFDEREIADELYLLFLAVDQDETSFAQDLGADLGLELLGKGLVRLARLLAGAASAPSGGAAFLGEQALEQAVSFAGGKALDLLQRRDVIGRQVIGLYRAGNWGAGQNLRFVSADGGISVNFHIARMAPALPSEDGLLLEVNYTPDRATPIPASPTPIPPTPIPQFIDRLVLFDPVQGDVGVLRDGMTIDLGAIGAQVLDVRAEIDPAYASSVGSVAFLLDGRPFCSHDRCAENVAPYIMNGDNQGRIYGDWNWSTLSGGTHTIGAFACTHTDANGQCAPVLTYTVRIQQ